MKTLSCCILFILLYDFSAFSENYYVKNIDELNSCNKKALPGDVIVLKNGIWNNCFVSITCKGNKNAEIYFKAEKNGKVIFTGNSSFHIGGEYIKMEGFYFKDGFSNDLDVWEFKSENEVANHCRISNCSIENYNNPGRLSDNNWVVFYGKNNRVDHCIFTNKTNLGVLLAVKMDDDRSRNSNHLIDSNYFGFRKPLGSNGGEIIRIGLAQHCTFNSNTIVRDNVFDHCDGETEIISIKSGGNTILRNIFKECQGAVVLRHGNNNNIERNIFVGNNKEGTGGVRIINEGNWVVNNLFIACRGEGFRSPLSIMNGVLNSPPTRYMQVKNSIISNNTFVNCSPMSFCEGADSERSMRPANVFFFNNLFYNKFDSAIFLSSDNMDGIYFSNNVTCNKTPTPSVNGFLNKTVSFKNWNRFKIPVFNEYTKAESTLPQSFTAQTNTRLTYGFPANTGSSFPNQLNEISNSCMMKGATWMKKSMVESVDKKIQKTSCNNAESIYNLLNKKQEEYFIELDGTSYQFTKPILLHKNTTITGNSNAISFNSTNQLSSLFIIKNGVSFKINNITIDNSQLKCNNFISTDSISDCIHYAISINNSTFNNLNSITTDFLNSRKSSYADSINILQTVFNNANCNLFSLNNESDNKGLYNVENISLKYSKFENCTGTILSLYRGGTDESTMGPTLTFSDNKIIHCNNKKPLIELTGVQQSFFTNNKFDHSNINSITLIYTDRTKAKHFQKKNEFINSGYIQENKFVTNLK